MKQALFIILCAISLTNTFGQSVILQPNTFQLPKVATNPACAAADRGKVIFNTNQNKILNCNGLTWIDPENGTEARISPAFSVRNSSQNVLTSNRTIEFDSKAFDLFNNFNLNDAETYPNMFITPINGIYEINFNAILDISGFVPVPSSRIAIVLSIESFSSVNNYFYEFPVQDYSNDTYIHLTKLVRLPEGYRASLTIRLDTEPTYGTLRVKDVNLTGHLVSWY